MKKLNYRLALWITVFVFGHGFLFAQETKISGFITDGETGDPLAGVNILVKGTLKGTITNVSGIFSLNVSASLPLTLIVSSIGYESQEIAITSESPTSLEIKLKESITLGQEVVISASRVEENILLSPVTVQKLDILDIRNAASTDFYDALKNLHGVDVSVQSFTFKSISPRGFNSNGNTRVVQLIDGIDNEAPGLNFSAGNLVGINELDLESVELISGPASALYGPNAIQGILLLESKSPFEYQGLSAYTKLGVNHIDGIDENPSFFQDYGARFAKAFNNKFAFKATVSYVSALDFVASDERHIASPAIGVDDQGNITRENNRSYNGTNVYGDFAFNFSALANEPSLAPFVTLLPTGEDGAFTPTGYLESSFIDNRTESFKGNAAVHFRPTDHLELIGQFNYGFGSSVYTANDRFVLDGFSLWSAKLELKGTDFHVRLRATQENSGDTYAANTVASLINQQLYLSPYTLTFVGARAAGLSIDQAHDQARAVADADQAANYAAGSPTFNRLVDSLRNVPLTSGGALLVDKSASYQADFDYDLSKHTKIFNLLIGGNIRNYSLNSEGTLFALEDDGSEVSYTQYGGFVQAKKTFFDEKLHLQGSIRYDKNPNFLGQFSPRVSATYTIADKHNLRASFQKGFRIPVSQDQFVDLDVVTRRLIGTDDFIQNRYNIRTNTVYNSTEVDNLRSQIAAGTITVDQAAAQLQPDQRLQSLKTEKITTWEAGYKGLLADSKLLIDAYYFLNFYNDFNTIIEVIQATPLDGVVDGVPAGILIPNTGPSDPMSTAAKSDILNAEVPTQRFGIRNNISQTVRTQGAGFNIQYSFNSGYQVGGNISYNIFNSDDRADLLSQNFVTEFNTPEWKYNLSLANREVIQNLGFNVTWRWQDAFLWESSYGVVVIPAYGTLDAQVSYKIPSINVIAKIGGSNVLNNRYVTGVGNPTLGGIYFLQLTFDQFLN